MSFERRVKMQSEAATTKEREIIERERHLIERETQLQERERALQQRIVDSEAQIDDFQKNRDAFEIEKMVFGKQKNLWEREKGTFLQTIHAQQATASVPEQHVVPRSSVTSISSTNAEKQRSTLNSSDERSVSRMLGSTDNAFTLTRSPSLPSVETGMYNPSTQLTTRADDTCHL